MMLLNILEGDNMAGIDKIYGTQEQYYELRDYLTKNHPDALRYLYPENYGCYDRPISNFPTKVDQWLLKRCPLEWVTDRIREQYNLDSRTNTIRNKQ
jgi:hypothetical protein